MGCSKSKSIHDKPLNGSLDSHDAVSFPVRAGKPSVSKPSPTTDSFVSAQSFTPSASPPFHDLTTAALPHEGSHAGQDAFYKDDPRTTTATGPTVRLTEERLTAMRFAREETVAFSSPTNEHVPWQTQDRVEAAYDRYEELCRSSLSSSSASPSSLSAGTTSMSDVSTSCSCESSRCSSACRCSASLLPLPDRHPSFGASVSTSSSLVAANRNSRHRCEDGGANPVAAAMEAMPSSKAVPVSCTMEAAIVKSTEAAGTVSSTGTPLHDEAGESPGPSLKARTVSPGDTGHHHHHHRRHRAPVVSIVVDDDGTEGADANPCSRGDSLTRRRDRKSLTVSFSGISDTEGLEDPPKPRPVPRSVRLRQERLLQHQQKKQERKKHFFF